MSTRTPTETEAVATVKASQVPHRWRNLSTITGVSVVDNTEAGLVSTLFPSIAAALRLDSGHLGILAALGKVVAVPFGPFWMWLAGRLGRKAALIITTVLGGVFGIVAGFAQDYVMLLVFNTLMSACLIGSGPISNTVIADSFDDRNRAKATGYYYGALTAISSFIGPLLALFTGIDGGWRYGMWAIGAICILAAIVVAVFFKDPEVGASERQLADLDERQRTTTKVTFRSVLSLFKIPSFSIMMGSRLLSGHLLITVFGIQFLVVDRGFDNATAALVLIPFGIGYVLGTIGGGFVVAFLDKRIPFIGRVAYIQLAQLGFAAAALFGTQFDHSGIAVYGVFWALFGFFQGVNPPVNRPIVMSIVTPELRGQAFAIWLTIFETIGWALFSLGAGELATTLGIQQVFLWVLVILMVVNALLLGALYFTYPRDARRVVATLDARRAEARGRV